MFTWNKIQTMTDEEIAAANKMLGRQLVKQIAITAAVTIAVHVAADLIVKKINNS
jgi:hypothetical protein